MLQRGTPVSAAQIQPRLRCVLLTIPASGHLNTRICSFLCGGSVVFRGRCVAPYFGEIDGYADWSSFRLLPFDAVEEHTANFAALLDEERVLDPTWGALDKLQHFGGLAVEDVVLLQCAMLVDREILDEN